jgi:hypothetical protein
MRYFYWPVFFAYVGMPEVAKNSFDLEIDILIVKFVWSNLVMNKLLVFK